MRCLVGQEWRRWSRPVRVYLLILVIVIEIERRWHFHTGCRWERRPAQRMCTRHATEARRRRRRAEAVAKVGEGGDEVFGGARVATVEQDQQERIYLLVLVIVFEIKERRWERRRKSKRRRGRPRGIANHKLDRVEL